LFYKGAASYAVNQSSHHILNDDDDDDDDDNEGKDYRRHSVCEISWLIIS
jgi:hypothetical protein